MFIKSEEKELLQQENAELKRELKNANYLIEAYKKMVKQYILTTNKLQERIAKNMPMELKIGAWQTMLEESAIIQKKCRENYINQQSNNEDEEEEEN